METKIIEPEFRNLAYVLKKAQSVLLFAHSGPDSDTTGSNLALREYMLGLGKQADIACFDPFPEYLMPISKEKFLHPDSLDFSRYDAFLALDSVERGFQKIFSKIPPEKAIILIDHHPDITLRGDINILAAEASSVCEIIYEFLSFSGAKITKRIATFLMLGILGDTGSFQHSNTTARVMEIASVLTKKGASVAKIVDVAFANKKISTLKLWGKAFEKAKINQENGMIVTVLTKQDLEECGSSTEDVSQVASILNTVPGTKFSLVLSEREKGIIKGSLRSEAYKGVDVSEIAHKFGGGGHKLASGFEVRGGIVETENGWEII